MRPLHWIVIVVALALIGAVNWYFFVAGRRPSAGMPKEGG